MSKLSAATLTLYCLLMVSFVAAGHAGRGGGGGGRGRHGDSRKGKRGGFHGRRHRGRDYITKECPVEEEATTAPPTCALLTSRGRRHHHHDDDDDDQVGSWVCRTKYMRSTGMNVTYNACIDLEKGLAEDECGCCTDTGCPALAETECACPCDDGEGVYLNFTKGRRRWRSSSPTDTPRCVHKERAITILAKPDNDDRVTCTEVCPVE